ECLAPELVDERGEFEELELVEEGVGLVELDMAHERQGERDKGKVFEG
ncbi:hypothetical protein A2U01_0086155, partial [Trifolium medium]|nr:hypothetical protein [Trifolium medium]